jgi:RNA polymerase sigma factor (sigma-70 family)
MTDDDALWDELIRDLIEGDDHACSEFWHRYGERLNRTAEKHLPRQFQRRVQPEDVVQSVCRTFFRRMSEGYFELGNAGQLWSLLYAITLNKVRMQVRYQMQGKRNLAREVGLDGQNASDARDVQRRDVVADDVDPQEAVVFAEQLEMILARLDEQEQLVVQLRLEGHDSKEIAQRLECTTRTVRRIMSRIRERLKCEFLTDVNSQRDGS